MALRHPKQPKPSTFFELDGEEIIASSLIMKELDFDQEIADIITKVFTDVEVGVIQWKDNEDVDCEVYIEPYLLKMAGYCKGGNCDSYWAIYLSNIGCLIFDDPLTISDYCKLYLWDKDEKIFEWASDNTENEELAKIKPLSDSNKNVNEIKLEFEKYQKWDEDCLFVTSNFREIADKIKLNLDLEELMYRDEDNENEYIFDSDYSYARDILEEISQIWPLKGRF